MSDQTSLHKTLEGLLLDATKLSIGLGEQGRHLQILVDIKDDSNYEAGGSTVNNQNYMPDCDLIKCKLYPERYNIDQSTCDSCFQDIYYSRYNGDDNSYMIIFYNIPKRVGREELEGLLDLIRNMEIEIIDSYHKSLYLYPNSLKNYSNPILSMDFKRNIFDYDTISKEIKQIDFAQLPTLREVGSKDKPIFSLAAIYGKKGNIPDKDVDVAHLEFPKNFRFSLMVYEK